jgi:hypothetical protein
MREVEKTDLREPEFWANLLGAVVNTNVAAIPDSVADALIQESLQHAEAIEPLRKEVEKAKEKRG